MERQTTHPTIQNAPFGYHILHTSSSGRSETPVDPQGHLRRAAVPQSKCIKEVPNLENVSAFLSDPLNVEEDAAPTSRMQVPRKPMGSGEECSEEWIDDFDLAKILKLVDRTLSSAWKFNPYFGASPGAMGPFPADLELTVEEFNFANRKKIIKDTASERRIRADSARGLCELKNINKRNKKNLSITPWPEDISFLNDKAFAEQVNLNAFCSRNSIPNDVHSGVHDTLDDVRHDDRQGVFKDSAIHMEDEFQKEATKGSPISSIRLKHERNEGAVTGSFLAPSPDEVDCESSISSELLQLLGHNVSDAAGFGTIPATDINKRTLRARLEGVSAQTSLALFDHSNATLGGQYDGPPYDVRDLAESSTLERAMEDTLYPSFDTMHGHNLQPEHQKVVGNELPPTDTISMGTSGGASLKTEEHVAPFSAGHDESNHDGFDFEDGFLPATNRSATLYQSPYNNMSVEDDNRLHNDLQAPSPVINANGRPSYGVLRLPGYPAVARPNTYSALHPTMSPEERQISNRILASWGTSTPIPRSGAPIPIPNAGAPIPNPNARGPIAIPNSGAPTPTPNPGAPATRPNNPPSPYDDAPAFSTRSRSRSRASSAASAAPAAGAGTPEAPSRDESAASPDMKTSKAKAPRRKNKSEAKAPRRKSTPKAKSRNATPAAGKSGGRRRARSVEAAQEGQPSPKRGRPRKKDDGGGAGLA